MRIWLYGSPDITAANAVVIDCAKAGIVGMPLRVVIPSNMSAYNLTIYTNGVAHAGAGAYPQIVEVAPVTSSDPTIVVGSTGNTSGKFGFDVYIYVQYDGVNYTPLKGIVYAELTGSTAAFTYGEIIVEGFGMYPNGQHITTAGRIGNDTGNPDNVGWYDIAESEGIHSWPHASNPSGIGGAGFGIGVKEYLDPTKGASWTRITAQGGVNITGASRATLTLDFSSVGNRTEAKQTLYAGSNAIAFDVLAEPLELLDKYISYEITALPGYPLSGSDSAIFSTPNIVLHYNYIGPPIYPTPYAVDPTYHWRDVGNYDAPITIWPHTADTIPISANGTGVPIVRIHNTQETYSGSAAGAYKITVGVSTGVDAELTYNYSRRFIVTGDDISFVVALDSYNKDHNLDVTGVGLTEATFAEPLIEKYVLSPDQYGMEWGDYNTDVILSWPYTTYPQSLISTNASANFAGEFRVQVTVTLPLGVDVATLTIYQETIPSRSYEVPLIAGVNEVDVIGIFDKRTSTSTSGAGLRLSVDDVVGAVYTKPIFTPTGAPPITVVSIGDPGPQELVVGNNYQLDINAYTSDSAAEPVSIEVIGELPPGIGSAGYDGFIIVSGTPTTAGVWEVDVRAYDTTSSSDTIPIVFTVLDSATPSDPTLIEWLDYGTNGAIDVWPYTTNEYNGLGIYAQEVTLTGLKRVRSTVTMSPDTVNAILGVYYDDYLFTVSLGPGVYELDQIIDFSDGYSPPNTLYLDFDEGYDVATWATFTSPLITDPDDPDPDPDPEPWPEPEPVEPLVPAEFREGVNYNIRYTDTPFKTFDEHYDPPYRQYIVSPRDPEDGPYIVDLDFYDEPLNSFVQYYPIYDWDVMEVFWLNKRVLLSGVQIVVHQTAPVLIQPVTDSGFMFTPIDCRVLGEHTLAVDGGMVGSDTDLLAHSFIVEEPDYIGLRVLTGIESLPLLGIRVQLMVNDNFDWRARTNRRKL